jgi:hypothetical protein
MAFRCDLRLPHGIRICHRSANVSCDQTVFHRYRRRPPAHRYLPLAVCQRQAGPQSEMAGSQCLSLPIPSLPLESLRKTQRFRQPRSGKLGSNVTLTLTSPYSVMSSLWFGHHRKQGQVHSRLKLGSRRHLPLQNSVTAPQGVTDRVTLVRY